MTDSENDRDPRGNFKKQRRTDKFVENRESETEQSNGIKIEDEDYAEQMRDSVERSLKPIKIYPENMKNKIKTFGSNALLFVVVLPSFLAILMPFVEHKDLSPLKMASESMQMIILCWIIKKTMQWPWCWQTEILEVRRGLVTGAESEKISFEEKGELVHKLGNYEKYAIFMCIVVAQLGAGLMVWYREFVDIEEPRRKLVFHNFNISIYLFFSWCRILLMVGWRYRENARAKAIQETASRDKVHKATKKVGKRANDAGCGVVRRKHGRLTSFFNPDSKSQGRENKPILLSENTTNSRVEYCQLVERMIYQRDELEKLAFSIKELERKLSSEDPRSHSKAIGYTARFPHIGYHAKGVGANGKNKDTYILPNIVNTSNMKMTEEKGDKALNHINSHDRPSSNEIKSSSTLSRNAPKKSLFEPTFGSSYLWQESQSSDLASFDDGSPREYGRSQQGPFSLKSMHSSSIYPLTSKSSHDSQRKIESKSDFEKSNNKNIIDLLKELFKLLVTIIFKVSLLNCVRKPILLKQIFYIELYPIIRQSVAWAQEVTIKKNKKLEWTWKRLCESTLLQRSKIVAKFYMNSMKIMLDLWILVFFSIPYNFLRFFSTLLFFIPKTYIPLFPSPIFHPMQKRK